MVYGDGPGAPMVDEVEVGLLAQAYGEPLREAHELTVGPSLFFTRFERAGDRRGEVVMAVERPAGTLLVHRKAHYRPDIYRLLSGGIDHGEPVLEAVLRETEEETGLQVQVVQFIAVLECRLTMGTLGLPFVSYLFHVRECGGRLDPDWMEIDDVAEIRPRQLVDLANRLRSLEGPRADWGRWRAIAHDVMAEVLA